MASKAVPPNEFLARFSTSRLIKTQAIAGLLFATFLILHLINIFSASLGVEIFSSVQELFRQYYQNPFVEATVVLTSLVVHIAANGVLYIRRRQREKNPKAVKPAPIAQKINRITGTILSVVVFMHMFGFRYFGFMDPTHASDFSLVTFSLFSQPLKFTVYYIMLGSAGLYHLCFGLLKASDLLFGGSVLTKATKSKWFVGTVAVGLALLLSSVYAFSGGYFDVRSSKAKTQMWAEHFAQLMGHDFSEFVVQLSNDK